MKKFQKISTDGIPFSPSLGLITRDTRTLTAELPDICSNWIWREKAKAPVTDVKEGIDSMARVESDCLSKETVNSGIILVSREGPVDLYGMGDTVFGHFDPETEAMQRKSGKGLMRVVTMCGLSAVTVPGKGAGCLHRAFVQQFAPGHPRDASVWQKSTKRQQMRLRNGILEI